MDNIVKDLSAVTHSLTKYNTPLIKKLMELEQQAHTNDSSLINYNPTPNLSCTYDATALPCGAWRIASSVHNVTFISFNTGNKDNGIFTFYEKFDNFYYHIAFAAELISKLSAIDAVNKRYQKIKRYKGVELKIAEERFFTTPYRRPYGTLYKFKYLNVQDVNELHLYIPNRDMGQITDGSVFVKRLYDIIQDPPHYNF